jgi:hypothetical protein
MPAPPMTPTLRPPCTDSRSGQDRRLWLSCACAVFWTAGRKRTFGYPRHAPLTASDGLALLNSLSPGWGFSFPIYRRYGDDVSGNRPVRTRWTQQRRSGSTEATLLVVLTQQPTGLPVDEMQPCAGRAGDRLILGFGNIRIDVQLVLDVEAGRRAPEDGIGHPNSVTTL